MSPPKTTNPFEFAKPVLPDELLDRDKETASLLEFAEQGSNARLVGPRRYGKTSLLHRVIKEARADGWAGVYVDFFGVLTLADIATRIEVAYDEQLDPKLGGWFRSLRRKFKPVFRVGGGTIPASVEVSGDPQDEFPLLQRLAIPRRLHEEKGIRTLVVFDEFQDVMSTREKADAVIRSEIQHQGDAASYIFAGSQVGMMRELFHDRRRAFYNQTHPLDLGPLDSNDIADHIEDGFERTGRDVGEALEPLLELVSGHPQRAMHLAHCLWRGTSPGMAADANTWDLAYEDAMAAAGYEFRALWTAMSVSERRLLATVASNQGGIYATQRNFGGSRGGAVTHAVRSLIDAGNVVEDTGTATGYRIVDPLFAAWINEGRHE